MTYTALQMLMDNLKHLIYGNNDPLIHRNPSILSQRPQFQLLHEELGSIIQTLFNIHEYHHLHELQNVKDLMKRFKDAAEEAQDIIDIFLSALHFRNIGFPPTSDVFNTSVNLENVMRSIESIKMELMTINIDDMKMDSSPSPRIDRLNAQSASGTSGTRNPLGAKKPLEEIVVGLDRDVELIRDKLSEDTKQLGVVSIVGMGGLGKTTLATKVFNDRFIVYHFHVRAWATVSQTYIKRDFLIQILASMGVPQDLEEASNSKLREMLHKHLMGKRYLIVIDDIWSTEAWDDLKSFFPHDNTGSRILLTSRVNEVALHAKPHGFVYSLPYLTEEESWGLLCKKVFHGDECPEWLITPGMQIAKKCHGLPLSVVVMAGVLAKEAISKDFWEKIASCVGSYIVGDQKEHLETLALSYHHLPDHLRECFLYLGGFPEDFGFVVERLIWLWVAEGFIEGAGNQSLEDTAKAYLMDLVDRNLVIVAERKYDGDLEACKLHDLVRELCVEKAKQERFFLKLDRLPLSSQLLEVMTPYRQCRVFTNQNIDNVDFAHPPFCTPSMRSLLCFRKSYTRFEIGEYIYSFALLRVLDLQKCKLRCYPQGMALLIHLRYLAFWHSSFPSSVCNLLSLQTLILKTSYGRTTLPSNISDLINLRHLWSNQELFLPAIEKPMNLQSISNVVLGDGVDNFGKYFPSIKKLEYTLFSGEERRFESLPYLEALKLTVKYHNRNNIEAEPIFLQIRVWFPATLKKLTLVRCFLPWSDMSTIQPLPSLEVLKLKYKSFVGTHWHAGEQQFRQLKFLTLERLDIKQWEAYSTSFPCLKRLAVWSCGDLEGIPLEIGEIATLELIETGSRNYSIVESIKRIQEEQDAEGNTQLQITVDGMDLSFYLSGQWKDDDNRRIHSSFVEFYNENDL
ncbi:putative late blight resistance protein homolog R1B-17 [Cynara cardunculus var. scolymus]|uniref:Disease resistance protein n=1 Tax=Cynara cardunculus var. scolymus TaxID=59895 RepID=A0A103Y7S5_CYNCS|nr:putative late blight resistance protein homolog R1B-17 [Cynara cardunculus var. scolymus]KVI04084.1 Disease resistance protein [Cynara cardunculus var. scolymus]